MDLKNGVPKVVVPLVTLLVLLYLNFATLYSVGYQEIYVRHSRHNVAISLWTIVSILDVLILSYWVLLFVTGPGRAPVIKGFNLYDHDNTPYSPLPQYFLGDENGYPYWCSTCQSIKLPRSFHLKHAGYCVLKFDHYCLWVGSPIGQNNYGYFLKFVLYALSNFVVSIVYLAVYSKSALVDLNSINTNYIFIYILSGFFLIFLIALLGSNLWYIRCNMTTLDDLSRKQLVRYARWQNSKRKSPKNKPRVENGKRYININSELQLNGVVLVANTSRFVITYDVTERPFSYGFLSNWVNVWLYGNSPKLKQYDAALFAFSLLVFFVPGLDIWVNCRRTRNSVALVGDPDDTSDVSNVVYESYCDSLSEEFMQLVRRQKENNKASIPKYLANLK